MTTKRLMNSPAQIPSIETIEIREDDFFTDSVVVEPVWRGVDRPRTGGIVIPKKNKTLAERTMRCMAAGAFWGKVEVSVDIHGQTFVSAAARCSGRTLNADLKRLGY